MGCKKSWVRIPTEAAHFSLKKEISRKNGLSQVLLCCLSCVITVLLSTSFHVYTYISTLRVLSELRHLQEEKYLEFTRFAYILLRGCLSIQIHRVVLL